MCQREHMRHASGHRGCGQKHGTHFCCALFADLFEGGFGAGADVGEVEVVGVADDGLEREDGAAVAETAEGFDGFVGSFGHGVTGGVNECIHGARVAELAERGGGGGADDGVEVVVGVEEDGGECGDGFRVGGEGAEGDGGVTGDVGVDVAELGDEGGDTGTFTFGGIHGDCGRGGRRDDGGGYGDGSRRSGRSRGGRDGGLLVGLAGRFGVGQLGGRLRLR
jgi:hypothetical protein